MTPAQQASIVLDMNSAEENTMHSTTIIRRPFDQVRPICSCGWLGTTCQNLADAKREAAHHAGLDAQ